MRYYPAILVFIILLPGQSIPEARKNEILIPPLTICATNPDLLFRNGYYFFKQKLFSGTIVEYDSRNVVHRRTSWWLGKEEKLAFIYYPDGSLFERRSYHAGEKDGVHTGWWENGKTRFEYHFRQGQYEGDYKEWYASGQLYKDIHYTNGVDDHGRGWRENGKLYMSYVMKDGRRYGLINPNLCYTVKNGSGEYVK